MWGSNHFSSPSMENVTRSGKEDLRGETCHKGRCYSHESVVPLGIVG